MPKQSQMKKRIDSTSKDRTISGVKNREDELDIRDARRALKEARKKGSLSWEQVKRETGI